jgi:Fe-S-cluster containining protein
MGNKDLTWRLADPPTSAVAGSLTALGASRAADLEALWFDLARRPLWRRPYTWRYLKLAARMRLSEIAHRRVTVWVPVGKVNACSECTDNCCIGARSTVSLHLRDIASLIDRGRNDLIVHERPVFKPEEIASNPALHRTLRSTQWRMFPVLRQNSFHACAALGVDGRCELHPAWPLSCARFPYSLHADDQLIFYSPRCSSFKVDAAWQPAAEGMAHAAVDAFNWQIRDRVLLSYVPDELRRLGLMDYLKVSSR